MEQERISQRMKPNKLVVATILGLAYVGYVGNNIRELGDLREQLGSSTVRRTEIERDRTYLQRIYDFLKENPTTKPIPSTYGGTFFVGFQDHIEGEVPMYGAQQGSSSLKMFIEQTDLQLRETDEEINRMKRRIKESKVFSLF
ncbi:hypothetical protein J4416_03735 [Candidatus Pacearchaeota archaeon]|nr:hypothetical protein [Candidatus Pacearchaeota archaeon]